MIELIPEYNNHLPVTFGNLECPNINEDHEEKQLLCSGFNWLIDKIKQIWVFIVL